MKFCHKNRKLIHRPDRAGMDHSEVIRLIIFLLTARQGDIIHKLRSTCFSSNSKRPRHTSPKPCFSWRWGSEARKHGSFTMPFAALPTCRLTP